MNSEPAHCSACGSPLEPAAERGGGLCPGCLEGLEDLPTAVLPGTLVQGLGAAPQPVVQATAFEAPEIPGLRVGAFLGRGGMGIVWQAEQVATGRTVAVKLIRGGPAWSGDPMARARFEREIELAARLDHPNIARVFDGGEVDGLPYCVMEFIEGRPVATYVQQERPGRRDVLVIMEKIADAVDHAHRRGVLHRDLKPGNILVTAAGEPKLLDFGLARGMDDSRQTLTLEGALAGTPAYMSPEQARGESKLIDTRSDVYSLGVVFYELLTGTLPYDVDGPLEKVLGTVARATVTRPRARDRSLPPDLEMLLLHALAAAPADRYASAGELAADLRRFLRHEPLAAGRTSTTYFLRKWVARNRYPVAAAAALLAVAAGATVYHWRTLGREKTAALAAEERATEALDKFLRAAITENMQRGDYRQALQLIGQAERAGGGPDHELVFQQLEALQASGDPAYVQQLAAIDHDGLSPAQRARLDYWQAERMLHQGEGEAAQPRLRAALATGLLPKVEEELARAALCDQVAEAVEHYAAAAQEEPWRVVAQQNLVLGLLLAGRVEEARAQLKLCHLLFPQDNTLRGAEVVLEALQQNECKALEIVEGMREDGTGAKEVLGTVVPAIAKFSRGIVASVCGVPVEMTPLDQLLLVGALGKVIDASGGRYAVPALARTGPVIVRGLAGLRAALLASISRDKERARETIREALECCDMAFVQILLSQVELALGNFDAGAAAARAAQTSPSMFPRVADAGLLSEGMCESLAWAAGGRKDASRLERANAAFRAAFKKDLPFEAARGAAVAVALQVGDLVFARQLAATMGPDSPEQLDARARIERADGNLAKALQIADNGVAKHPDNATLRDLAAQLRAGPPPQQQQADEQAK